MKLATLTIRVNRKALEECLRRAQRPAVDAEDEGDERRGRLSHLTRMRYTR